MKRASHWAASLSCSARVAATAAAVPCPTLICARAWLVPKPIAMLAVPMSAERRSMRMESSRMIFWMQARAAARSGQPCWSCADKAPPPGLNRAPDALRLFPSPRTREGSGAPQGAPIKPRLRGAARVCETRSPRGAPLAALARTFRFWLSSGPRLRIPAMNRGRQRAPRTGAVVPQGQVPKPPGSTAANRARGRRASGLADSSACLPPEWTRISTPASGLLRHQDAS